MASSNPPSGPGRSSSGDRELLPHRIGPVLYFRGCEGGRLHLAALLVRPADEPPPVALAADQPLAALLLHRRCGVNVFRYDFCLPSATGGAYLVADQRFEVAGIADGDLRLAYVSCNGQERGDRARSLEERNAMWQRLAQQHVARPLNLLLHGGDQLYADEMLDIHPAVRMWADNAIGAADDRIVEAVGERLRDYLLRSYLQLYSQPAPAALLARVPSLCMWDDHDICDGWGSMAASRMESPIGREVFRAAREFFLLFQLGCTPDVLPSICVDRGGATLTWSAELPGLRIIAPDLRSERLPDRIMGPAGWDAVEQCLSDMGAERVLMLSSVPLLGPRLSWVEAVMHLMPRAQKYEDDLRDQWQSRTHRDEWRRMLRAVLAVHERGESPVTVLSGEIHLATRCTMAPVENPLHQLIASGITHPPPPRWYARILGTLARLGESPLAGHPIRLHPLPGQRSIYTAQRNYLMLERRDGGWVAWWELEHDGSTPLLDL